MSIELWTLLVLLWGGCLGWFLRWCWEDYKADRAWWAEREEK